MGFTAAEGKERGKAVWRAAALRAGGTNWRELPGVQKKGSWGAVVSALRQGIQHI